MILACFLSFLVGIVIIGCYDYESSEDYCNFIAFLGLEIGLTLGGCFGLFEAPTLGLLAFFTTCFCYSDYDDSEELSCFFLKAFLPNFFDATNFPLFLYDSTDSALDPFLF